MSHSAEAKFQKLFENCLEGMYQSSPDGKFITVNPALVRLLGYESEEELLRVNIAQDIFWDAEVREALNQDLEKEASPWRKWKVPI